MLDRKNNLESAVITFSDITEIKIAEKNLQQKHRDLVQSQEIANVGTWKWDHNTGSIEWSDMMYNIYGFDTKEPPPPEKVREIIIPEDRHIYDKAMEGFAEGNIPKEITYSIRKKNGEIRNIVVQAEILTSPEGEKQGLMGVVQDVTEYVRKEKEIKNLLTEKDIILREVHHRIKNDMNTIRSLIVLQAEQSNNDEAKEILLKAENRITIMGNIYNALYRSTSFTSINIKNYLQDLILNLQKTNTLSQPVSISTDITSIDISPRDSFPIGIIINELVNNAFKYAFSGKTDGEIKIALQKKEESQLEIIVADNGIGIADEIINNKNFGFGLVLVDALAKQLMGKVVFQNDSGTTITASIYIRKPNSYH